MVTFSFYSNSTVLSYKMNVRAEPGLRKISVKLPSAVLSLYKPPETPGPGPKRQQSGAGGFLAAAELARKSGKIL
ncbi:hypothetical protein DPQ25_09615 [Hydrogeniiclostridium mannosilyticum]|uniref:Uncharacterized protein n=1 Tax=Hydrogeniiclostridium mannosilyticum TaxID=2764322 RepID=A0A328UAI9_9FIRM|nr:hypothetical protein DPQ25_09615 [Hydrogeniiclostridium mannosilyticum]